MSIGILAPAIEELQVHLFLRDFDGAAEVLQHIRNLNNDQDPALVDSLEALILHQQMEESKAVALLRPICYSPAPGADAEGEGVQKLYGYTEGRVLAHMLYADITISEDENEALRLMDEVDLEFPANFRYTDEEVHGFDALGVEAEIACLIAYTRHLRKLDINAHEHQELRGKTQQRILDLRKYLLKSGRFHLLARAANIPCLVFKAFEAWIGQSLQYLGSISVPVASGGPMDRSRITHLARGLMRATLAKRLLDGEKIDAAGEQLEAARSIFAEHEWWYGLFRVRNLVASFKGDRAGSPAEAAFDELTELASEFRQRRCGGDYLFCLIDQINAAKCNKQLVKRCDKVFDDLEKLLEHHPCKRRMNLLTVVQRVGLLLTVDLDNVGSRLITSQRILEDLNDASDLGPTWNSEIAHANMLLGCVYSHISEYADATKYFGEAAVRYAKSPREYDISMASEAAYSQGSSVILAHAQRVVEARRIWLDWLDFDKKHSLLSNMQKKLVRLVMSFRCGYGGEDTDQQMHCEKLLQDFRKDHELLNASEMPYHEVDCGSGKTLPDIQREVVYLEKLVKAANEHPDEVDITTMARIYNALAMRQVNSAILLSDLAPKNLNWQDMVKGRRLAAARNTNLALHLFSSNPVWYVEAIIDGAVRLRSIQVLLEGHVPAEVQSHIARDVGRWLDFGLELLDEMQESFNLTGNLKTLRRKMNLEHNAAKQLFSAGVGFYLEGNDVERAWDWVQKSKSQNLSQLIGITDQASAQRLIDSLSSGDKIEAKIKKEEKLQTEAAAGNIKAAQELTELRSTMGNDPELRRVMAIRKGQLQSFGDGTTSDTELSFPEQECYVDWFLSQSEPKDIYCFCRTRKGIQFRKLPVSLSGVLEWMETYLERDGGDDNDTSTAFKHSKLNARVYQNGVDIFSPLEPLVAPLAEWTKGNDLLVLCPSGPLHRLPLHAVMCGEERLVDRNPIVYTTGISLHRQCTQRAQSKRTSCLTTGNAITFLGTLRGAIGPEEAETANIANCLVEAAGMFQVASSEVVLDGDVTETRFRQACAESRWVHFQGHAQYDEDDALRNQGFGLALEESDALGSNGTARNFDILHAEDIFGMQMHEQAPHFTTICCQTTRQQSQAGKDDPLGIVSALLFAGAASTIGCLWSIDSKAGREFTQNFYSHIEEQIEHLTAEDDHKEVLVIDLAEALRKTMIMMKDDRKFYEPIHWAPFVLHGSRFIIFPNTTRADQLESGAH